jgi:hypothetical protein
MLRTLRCRAGSAIFGSCFLFACSVVNENPNTNSGEGGSASNASRPSSNNEQQVDPASNESKSVTGAAGKPPVAGARDAGSAQGGAAGHAPEEDAGMRDASVVDAGAEASDDAGDDSGNDESAECDLADGGCVATCSGQSVTCTVESVSSACEPNMFADASATVACGQTVTVGTSCCGGCGCVPVQLYFDGKRCWEGMPACALSQFAGKFFDPHAP